MEHAAFEALLKRFTAAVEQADGTALGALFTPDGVYHDTFYGDFTSPAAIANMLERFHQDAKDFRWSMREPATNGKFGYARWTFSYTSLLAGCQGKRVVVEGMSRFVLSQGQIAHYTESFPGGCALTQLGFAPERLKKVLGRWEQSFKQAPQNKAHL